MMDTYAKYTGGEQEERVGAQTFPRMKRVIVEDDATLAELRAREDFDVEGDAEVAADDQPDDPKAEVVSVPAKEVKAA
jgi:hypothetical protein